jgi:hypothetical protein
MNTKLQAQIIEEEAVVNRSYGHVHSNQGYEFSTLKAVNDAEIPEAPKKERSLVKTAGMFLAAPFIALAYVIALPFIGLYHFAKMALEAYAKRVPAADSTLKIVRLLLKNIGLFFAAPFIALAYVIALPFVGMYMFSKLAMEAKTQNG